MSSNNFLVIWVPHVQIEINTLSKACEVGGRLIFDDLSYGEAEEMKKILSIGAPQDGFYIVIKKVL